MTAAPREQFADVGREITLCFEEIGDSDATPLVLIAGLGQQLISWPTPLCEMFAERGFRVIRFDNRDSGRSTHIDAPAPGPLRMLTGRYPTTTYGLHDMARDTRGLLEALNIQKAHLVGASMGGMIAQVVASRWPDLPLSVTSMFSTTGAPGQGRPAWSTWLKMASSTPTSEMQMVEADEAMFAHIGSHGLDQDAEWIREQAGQAWRRDPSSAGVSRQLAAILSTGDRTAELGRIKAPTLIIHGDRDRMVSTSGGRATHAAISHSRLWIVPGLGHDYPRDLWPRLVDAVGDMAHPAHPNAEAQAPAGASHASPSEADVRAEKRSDRATSQA